MHDCVLTCISHNLGEKVVETTLQDSGSAQYSACSLITYNTLHLSKSDKVRFYYALKGRDGKSGMVNEYNVEQLAKTVLLVHPERAEHVLDFLLFWKCAHEKCEVFIRE